MDFGRFIKSPCLPLILISFLEYIAMTGRIKAMGVVFQDLSNSIPMDSTDFGMMFSVFFGVSILTNPIVSAVYSRFPRPRLFLVIGTTLEHIAIVFASLATRTFHLFVAFAISGIGYCGVIMISCVELEKESGERFNLLYSISTCGFSFGIVLLPLLAEELLSPYGWRGALLINGGLFLNVIPCAMAVRNTQQVPGPEDNAAPAEGQLNEFGNEHDESHSGISGGLSADKCDNYYSVAATRNAHEDTLQETDRIPLLDHSTKQDGTNPAAQDPFSFDKTPVDSSMLNKITNITDGISSAFRNSNYYTDPISTFIFLSDGVHYIIYAGWHIFLIPHATQRGISSHNIIIITFVAALGNFAIRPTIAFLTNGHVDPINMHLVLSIVNICSLLCDAFVPSFYIMLITSFISATAIAGRAVLCPLVIRGRVSSEQFQTAFCIYCGLANVGAVIGGYVSGRIADMFSSYDATFKLLAGIDVLTFVFMLVPRVVKKPDCQ